MEITPTGSGTDIPAPAFPDTPARQVRVLHFADVHLGVQAYGRTNQATGLHTRLEDFTRALDSLIDRGLEADIDIALFAGDAYRDRDPSQTHQRAFAQAIRRLTAAGIPVCLLIGNHDIPNTRGRAHTLEIYDLLSDRGVTIFSDVRTVPIRTRKGTVLVSGMPYLIRSRVLANEDSKGKSVSEISSLLSEKYTYYLAQLAKDAAEKPDHIALLMGHFTVLRSAVSVQGSLNDAGEPKVAVSDIGLPQFDYVALGHIHKHQSLNTDRQPPVVYSGSVERVDLGECGEAKGGVLVDVIKGRAQWRHITGWTRPMYDITVTVNLTDDPMERIRQELSRYEIVESILRLKVVLPAERLPLLRRDEVKQMVGAAHYFALVVDTGNSGASVRSREFGESMNPERALDLYLKLKQEKQEITRQHAEELLRYARPLLEAELQREEVVSA